MRASRRTYRLTVAKHILPVFGRKPALAVKHGHVGESPPMIGCLLGHIQVETTLRHVHLAEDSLRDSVVWISDSIAADLLGDYVAG